MEKRGAWILELFSLLKMGFEGDLVKLIELEWCFDGH